MITGLRFVKRLFPALNFDGGEPRVGEERILQMFNSDLGKWVDVPLVEEEEK
jgi:hypothetical protein